MSRRELSVVLIEDSDDDSELIARALAEGGYAAQLVRVESDGELRGALGDGEYDLAITDHELPSFDSTRVLGILAELAPDLPCLLVSGKVGEEAVGVAMRHGAVDYVAKHRLGRLPAAVERTLISSERRSERRAADAALARSGRLFEAVFANARDAMMIVDDERCVVDANPAAAAMLGLHRGKLVNRHVESLLPEVSRPDAPDRWDEFVSAGERRGEVDLLRSNGALVPTEYTAVANFVPGRHILVLRDIEKRRAAEADADRHTAQQKAITEFSEEALRGQNLDLLMESAVTRVAETLRVEVASILELRAAEREFVMRAETGLEQARAGVRVHHGSQASSQASYTVHHAQPVLIESYEEETRFERDPILGKGGVRSALSVKIPGQQHPFGVLCAASRATGAFTADDANFLTALANILADALQRAVSEDRMRELALHDSLTGLPNRTLFFDRLTLALARTQRQGTRLAVLFLDVDLFKSFNDTLGHRAADRLLTQVGARIERTMRDTDTVARFGGDEFVVLCEDLADDAEVEVLTDRLVSAFASPFSLDEECHDLTASIGVALSDKDNRDGEALLRDADLAMYISKESGRARWTLATEAMRVAIIDRVETKSALEKAIDSDSLLLHYQPIAGLEKGELRAVEALVRWDDPEAGLIPPGQFIPIAEESGLILRLGEWVVRAACRQAALWRAEFGARAPLPIHVNFSARQVAQPDLPALVRGVLEETGVPPGDIALEITESALIDTLGGPLAALTQLRDLGIGIVLDDFGTGYSSLSYLDRFPIDVLKIDRAFVAGLTNPSAPAPIVSAIVSVAGALHVGTVAEGVETAEQGAAVAALGCEQAQGFFFARPGPAEEITRLVHDDTPLRERAAEARALTRPVDRALALVAVPE